MILTIVLAVYAVGALIFARLLAGHLAWRWKSKMVDRPEPLDWLAASCFALLGCWLWLPALALRGVRHVSLPAIGAERDARIADHQRQLELAQKRIAELERDTGVQ